MASHQFTQGSSTDVSQQGYGSAAQTGDRELSKERGGNGRSPTRGLQRNLSARQVQMIAIAGTIGTGLFLGTGRSLAQGGPASMLICYSIIGFIVYVTLLLLGEMATQYPVAGSFNAYTTRFFSPSYGFALGWNYWFNDAVSVASDLTAAQLVVQFWGVERAWAVSVVFWAFLVGVNAVHVRAYGEMGECQFLWSIRAHSKSSRVLALLSQGCNCGAVHHSRGLCQRGLQRGKPLHWLLKLEYRRRTIRWRVRRVRESLRHC